MKCIILARSQLTLEALRTWRRRLLGPAAVEECSTECDILFNWKEFRREGGIPAYKHLTGRIEAASELTGAAKDYDSVIVLVDSVRPFQMDAAKEGMDWEKLVAMLVLTFPEVRWGFGSLLGKVRALDKDDFPVYPTSLPSLLRVQQHSDLFDASGLRDWIRALTEGTLMSAKKRQSSGPQSYLPRRRKFAIAVDDENSYAYLNAYSAYRFGYRASPVYSYTLATELLGSNAVSFAKGHDEPKQYCPAIIFEDIFVNFPDGLPGLSNLEGAADGTGRASVWPMVESEYVEHRIFITSDQRLHGDESHHSRNRRYIAHEREKGRNIRVLLKPYAGIYQLWKEAGLARTTEGFCWPPHRTRFEDHPHDHSTSGSLLWVAETLIHRAEEILNSEVSCARQAVRGAVLATDALELLGGRTGTVSIQALRLKHCFEILAECQFAGVEHHFEINDRLGEIRRDIRHITSWFGQKRRERAALNSEMQVLLELARVLREYGHFDEEQMLMNRIRTIHNELWMRQRPWRLVFWPILRYVDFLLESFPRFIFSLLAWVVLVGVIGWIADVFSASHEGIPSFRSAAQFSIDAFIGKVLPPDSSGAKDVIYVAAGVAGLLHIGAFISLIYSKVTRK